jgi:hypothetical protein
MIAAPRGSEVPVRENKIGLAAPIGCSRLPFAQCQGF